jgi:hypothetical protein
MVLIFELLLVLGFVLVGVGSLVVIVLVIRTWLRLSTGKGSSTGLRAGPSSLQDPAVDWATTQHLATSHVSNPIPPAAHHSGTDSSRSYDLGGAGTAPDYTRDASHVSTDLWGDFGGGNAGGGGSGGSWGDAGGGGDLGGGGDFSGGDSSGGGH